MESIRSDLAVELCEQLQRNNPEGSGIQCVKEFRGTMKLETVRITTEEGARLLGKSRGTYMTLNTGKLWLDDRETLKNKVLCFRDLLREITAGKIRRDSTVLVAGLGNDGITADAIGPITVKNLVITRHIRNQKPLIFEELGLFDLCALTPGVLGQTGIESAHVIASVVEKIHPDLVLAVDALASRNLERLVTTVQLSDSGIHPGSGVGNDRPGLDPEVLGIPVISLGVPTVVDAATLAADAIRTYTGSPADLDAIRESWKNSNLNFFVTPKETDQIIREMASFLAYGINLAFNESLSFEDMLSLIG